ncbi:Structural maintenance of chromosomes protein 6 [Cucumispora dikerogammari]|nr:Structural maintenance of chromosomes protein 6 [Cucumispora dikerogammari]
MKEPTKTNKKLKPTPSLTNEILISEVELLNFMCHKQLKVQFKSGITCINGINGSGKSSIMIAIGILLGQRASNMERGTLKNLIKKGTAASVISLKLNNHKKYKPDFFKDGPICIQKTITASTTTFKISNGEKNTFSKKVSDLDAILDTYNINLNILNFLTQDNSKKFLNVSNEKDLYKLFMDSTNLEAIGTLYFEAIEFIKQIEDKMETETEEIDDLKKEIKTKDALISNILNVEKNKNEIDELNKINKLFDLSRKEQSILEIEDEIKEKNSRKAEFEMELVEIQAEIQNEKSRKEALLKKSKDLQVELMAFYEAKNSEKREIEMNKMEIKSDIEMFKSQIVLKSNELKKYQKVNYETELEMKNIELKQDKATLEHEIEGLNFEIEKLEKSLEPLIIKEEERKKMIFSVERQIDFYKKQTENQLSFFGKNIKEILREIRQTSFKDLIIGPVGLYLDIKNPEYSTAVSVALKNRLSCFIVFNGADNMALTKIFRKYGVAYPIICPSKKHLNIKYNEEMTVFDSVLKMLKPSTDITNNISSHTTLADSEADKENIIKDILIMFDSVETTYLSRDRETAYRIYKELRNVDRIIIKNGDIIRVINKTLTEFRPKSIRSYFKGNELPFLKKKLAEMQKIDELPAEIIDLLTKYQIKNHSVTGMNQLLARLNDIKKHKSNQKTEKESTIKDIEFELKLQAETADSDFNRKMIKTLEDETILFVEQLKNVEAQLIEFDEQIKHIEAEIERKREDMNISLKEINVARATRDFYMERLIKEGKIRDLEKAIDDLHERLMVLGSEDMGEISERDLFNQAVFNKPIEARYIGGLLIKAIKEYLDKQEGGDVIECNQIQVSLEQTPRVEIEKSLKQRAEAWSTVKTLQRIAVLTSQNEALSSDSFNLEDIQAEQKALREELTKKEQLVNSFLSEIKALKVMSERGLEKMEEFKLSISEEVSKYFSQHAAVRGYKGKLEFDHEDQTLEVLMNTVLDTPNLDVTGEKVEQWGSKGSLSGGERSFAGICLLLSIYAFISSPLKILDECDVFMDNLNRNAAFKMIFKFFKMRGDQVILITPLGFKGFTCDVITIDKH